MTRLPLQSQLEQILEDCPDPRSIVCQVPGLQQEMNIALVSPAPQVDDIWRILTPDFLPCLCFSLNRQTLGKVIEAVAN